MLELLDELELEDELLVELEEALLVELLLDELELLLDDELLEELLLPLSDWAPHAPSVRALRQTRRRITDGKGMGSPRWLRNLTTCGQ